MVVAPTLESITSSTSYWGNFCPSLGLIEDSTFEFQLYVLQCAPSKPGDPFNWYVGLSEKENIKGRLIEEFGQTAKAAYYCQMHKPQTIEVMQLSTKTYM